MSKSNFSILVDVDFQTTQIRKKLKQAVDDVSKQVKIDVRAKGLDETEKQAKEAKNALEQLASQGESVGLTFQEANLIFSRSVEAISSMVEQVYQLDSALIEFRKVSNLSGDSLDKYVTQLQNMGNAVARTGKPKCLSRGVGMVNQRQELFKIQ